MVYKKYIKRGDKKFGPYYFRSVRKKDGSIESIYLGRGYKPKKSFSERILNVGKLYKIFLNFVLVLFLCNCIILLYKIKIGSEKIEKNLWNIKNE